MSNKQRVVVVTGGGSGMGRAIAQRFAENGDKVFVVGRRESALKETAKNSPANIEAVVGDVTSVEDVKQITNTVLKESKVVDVLVNCAGASGNVGEDLPLEEAFRKWHEGLGANLHGTFLMTYVLTPHLAQPGGRIINITSVAAFQGSSRPGGEVYSAAKSGVHGMSRTLAKHLSAKGITVNCVAPGLIDDTGFFGGNGVPEDRKEKYMEGIPLGRIGKPSDVAAAVFYLASEEASFITGEILNVNGGSQFGR